MSNVALVAKKLVALEAESLILSICMLSAGIQTPCIIFKKDIPFGCTLFLFAIQNFMFSKSASLMYDLTTLFTQGTPECPTLKTDKLGFLSFTPLTLLLCIR